jgi:hypothetical protein
VKAAQAEWAEHARDGLRVKLPDRTNFAKRTSSDDDPGLTDRVGPPVSERQPNRISSVVEKTDKCSDGRLGQTGREEVGHGGDGK